MQRKFLPLFLTQFLGAFNDNFFKNALVIFITFKAASQAGGNAGSLVALCGGVFILPFFIFSASAGQLADKYDKARMIQVVKAFEIGIMVLGAVGFMTENISFLISILFLMGLHSTFFGPLKYGILPQHLAQNDLVAGNGLIEMGTFLAILLGTMAGGVGIAQPNIGKQLISVGILAVSVVGLLSSFFIPKAPSPNVTLKINWNFLGESFRLLKYTAQFRGIFNSILGISWFWFLGGSFLTILPDYCKTYLGGNEQVVTLFLTVFSVGIGIGSILCSRLSKGHVELGLVPIGSFGLSIFTLDLFFATPAFSRQTVPFAAPLIGFSEFIGVPGHWRILIDLFLLSVSGGLFTVPLYSFIQHHADRAFVSRIIAGNNIMNALWMVLSAVFLMAYFKMGFHLPAVFLVLTILNGLVAWHIYRIIPEFLLRFIAWIVVNIIYRLKVEGLENIPKKGPAVVVCNHVSFVDAIIVGAESHHPIRFVIDHLIYRAPFVHHVSKKTRAIPIAPLKEDPDALEKAFDEISAGLKAGDIICIFPEGKITQDGQMNPFRPGIEKIIARDPVPVIPMALVGLWGSWFSRKGGRALSGFPHRIFFPVTLRVGSAIAPQKVTAAQLQDAVQKLLQE